MNKILLTVSMLIACIINTSGQDLHNYYFKSTENIQYQQELEEKVKIVSEFIIENDTIYHNNKLIKHSTIEEGYYKDNLVLTTEVFGEEFKWLALTVNKKGEVTCVQFHRNEIVIEPSKRNFILFK